MRKQDANGSTQIRQFVATNIQRACAPLFALLLLGAGAAKATLVVPLAEFQADVLSTTAVCGAPGPNCGQALGLNETTTPQTAEVTASSVHLLASTNPGPQIESLTTTASGTFGNPSAGGTARALTQFYVAVEQTNQSVPTMAVPVIITVGMSAGAEAGSGGPNAQTAATAALLVNQGFLTPTPHIVGGTQTYSVNDTCTLAGCSSSVCDPVGGCTTSPPSTTVSLQQGFLPGETFLSLTMIAQGSGSSDVDGDFTALIDPHIVIDPSFAFANDFAIVLSPNIITAAVSAVPEPTSALVLGPAVFGFALALRRRRLSEHGS